MARFVPDWRSPANATWQGLVRSSPLLRTSTPQPASPQGRRCRACGRSCPTARHGANASDSADVSEGAAHQTNLWTCSSPRRREAPARAEHERPPIAGHHRRTACPLPRPDYTLAALWLHEPEQIATSGQQRTPSDFAADRARLPVGDDVTMPVRLLDAQQASELRVAPLS